MYALAHYTIGTETYTELWQFTDAESDAIKAGILTGETHTAIENMMCCIARVEHSRIYLTAVELISDAQAQDWRDNVQPLNAARRRKIFGGNHNAHA